MTTPSLELCREILRGYTVVELLYEIDFSPTIIELISYND